MKYRSDGTARCTDCGQDPEDGRSRCAEHLKAHRQYTAERSAHRRALGLCVTCGVRAEPDRTLCATHLRYYAERDSERRANQ